MVRISRCGKCKLSAFCVPAGGTAGLAKIAWCCRNCKRLFLRGVLDRPLTSLALPPECVTEVMHRIDPYHEGVCEECYEDMCAEPAY